MNLNSLPVVIRRDVPTAQLPAVYETAKKALAACVALDECKEWSDKAAALASYARQAKNTILEDHAKRIRLRALNRAGELLLEIPAATGGLKGQINPKSRKFAAIKAGLSHELGSVAIRLAATPKTQREALIEGPNPPSNSRKLRDILPKRFGAKGAFVASNAYKTLNSGNGSITSFICRIRQVSPKPTAREFTSEEAERIRPVLIEIAEWVDEFERNLPRVKK